MNSLRAGGVDACTVLEGSVDGLIHSQQAPFAVDVITGYIASLPAETQGGVRVKRALMLLYNGVPAMLVRAEELALQFAQLDDATAKVCAASTVRLYWAWTHGLTFLLIMCLQDVETLYSIQSRLQRPFDVLQSNLQQGLVRYYPRTVYRHSTYFAKRSYLYFTQVRFPANSSLVEALCRLLVREHKLDEVIAFIKKLFADPPAPAVCFSLVYQALHAAGRIEDGLAFIQHSALIHHPGDTIFLDNLARGLAMLKRYKESCEVFEKLVALEPENLASQILYAKVLIFGDRISDGKRRLESTLEQASKQGANAEADTCRGLLAYLKQNGL